MGRSASSCSGCNSTGEIWKQRKKTTADWMARRGSPPKAASVAGEQKPDQNVSFSANWIWRSRFAVSVISPAVPLMLVSEKTIAFGVSKFA